MSRLSGLWFATRKPTGSTLTQTPEVGPSPAVRGSALSEEMMASSHLSPFHNISRGTPLAASITAGFESTTSTTFTDLATVGPQVTVPIGLSGLLLVGVRALVGAATNAEEPIMGFTLSGANTQSANDNYALWGPRVGGVAGSMAASDVFVLQDLSPGLTTVTAKYRSKNGIQVTFQDRRLFALPL